ncbi:MAG TPA: RNA pseudouridine synthase [Caulobacteraceae bacterium]|nr:RNA pseudouridine synthase [Caulobacteraceae bacterium]
MSGPASVRADRLLANLGYGSRREVQGLMATGAVTLDGARLHDPGRKLAAGPELAARMCVEGAPLDPPPPLNLMIHKPLGVVCSHHEPGRSLYELLPSRWRRRTPLLSTIGRLDLDTTGLLLLTDDGAFLHRVISPRRHVAKRYHVTLAGPLAGGEEDRFAAGDLMLEGDTAPLAPARLEALTPTTVWLTITEGRYHQVRRMFAAVGARVTALHRDRIGALDLPGDLAPGRFRILSGAEQAALFSA